jgi:signal peptidase II
VFFVFTGRYFTGILVNTSNFDSELFSIRHLNNTGAAFSIMQNSREALIILAVVFLTLIFLYVIKHIMSVSLKEMFFISLMSAGIAGNLHERIVLGFVRDFFKLNIIDFPIFNISDIFITVGVAALIILILIKKTK